MVVGDVVWYPIRRKDGTSINRGTITKISYNINLTINGKEVILLGDATETLEELYIDCINMSAFASLCGHSDDKFRVLKVGNIE